MLPAHLPTLLLVFLSCCYHLPLTSESLFLQLCDVDRRPEALQESRHLAWWAELYILRLPGQCHVSQPKNNPLLIYIQSTLIDFASSENPNTPAI